MRVRILQLGSGVVDGVSVSHLIPGVAYDLEPTLARYLIARRWAEGLRASVPALIIPLDNALAFEALTRGVTVTLPTSEAANRPPRRRRKR